MSTPTSETHRPAAASAPAEQPICWLTSGEEVFWSQPRACYRLGVASGPDPDRALLALRIDPPAVGQAFGLGSKDIDTIVVTPVAATGSVDPLSPPVDVHLLLPRRPWDPARTAWSSDDLQLMGRGKLVGTREEAETRDQAMQRMNGPRR